MLEDRSVAALFRVDVDSAGRVVGSVRYLAPLAGTQPQRLCALAGRDAFLAALVELLDSVAGRAGEDRRVDGASGGAG